MHAESGQTAPIVIPRYLSREELRARVAPTGKRLTKLAKLMADHEQVPVVVELWQYRFDSGTNTLLAEKRGEARGEGVGSLWRQRLFNSDSHPRQRPPTPLREGAP